MGLTPIDYSFRHIVNVDGVLLGIEQDAVDAEHLLRRAGLPEGRRLVRLSGEQVIPIAAGQKFQLCEDDVPFFRSVPVTASAAGSVTA